MTAPPFPVNRLVAEASKPTGTTPCAPCKPPARTSASPAKRDAAAKVTGAHLGRTAYLLLVLPDGSKTLVPPAWTDLFRAGMSCTHKRGRAPDVFGSIPAPGR